MFAAAIALLLGWLSTLFGVGLGILFVSIHCLLLGLVLRLPKRVLQSLSSPKVIKRSTSTQKAIPAPARQVTVLLDAWSTFPV
jgi:uncharacterized membrane protein YfcA